MSLRAEQSSGATSLRQSGGVSLASGAFRSQRLWVKSCPWTEFHAVTRRVPAAVPRREALRGSRTLPARASCGRQGPWVLAAAVRSCRWAPWRALRGWNLCRAVPPLPWNGRSAEGCRVRERSLAACDGRRPVPGSAAVPCVSHRDTLRRAAAGLEIARGEAAGCAAAGRQRVSGRGTLPALPA